MDSNGNDGFSFLENILDLQQYKQLSYFITIIGLSRAGAYTKALRLGPIFRPAGRCEMMDSAEHTTLVFLFEDMPGKSGSFSFYLELFLRGLVAVHHICFGVVFMSGRRQ